MSKGLLLNAERNGIIKILIAEEQKLLNCGTKIAQMRNKNCSNAEQKLLNCGTEIA